MYDKNISQDIMRFHSYPVTNKNRANDILLTSYTNFVEGGEDEILSNYKSLIAFSQRFSLTSSIFSVGEYVFSIYLLHYILITLALTKD